MVQHSKWPVMGTLSTVLLRTKSFEGVAKGNTVYQLSELFVQHGSGIEEM